MEPECPEKLADAIKVLKNSNELRNSYIINATKFLTENMTDKVCTSKISNLLKCSIAKKWNSKIYENVSGLYSVRQVMKNLWQMIEI